MIMDPSSPLNLPPGTDAAFVQDLERRMSVKGATRESAATRQAVYCVDRNRTVAVLRELILQDGGRLATVSGIDVRDGTELIYHVCFDAARFTVNLKTLVSRGEDKMESITPWLPGAEFIEREIRDLLGVDFEGHPRMKRLILSDDWPEGVYPLRRGFRKEDSNPPTAEES